MADAHAQDLDTAIAALSSFVESVGRRTEVVEAMIAERTKGRKSYLTQISASMLPSTSNQVLSDLKTDVPAFLTGEVLEAFARHKKFLGLFSTRGYTLALQQLQTRLASYLDQSQYGELRGLDAQLAQLSEELSLLHGKSSSTLELIKLMEQARRQNTPLPEEASVQIHRIASAARERGAQPSRVINSPVLVSSQQPTSTEDSSDLWFYLVTDIPISMRTLLIDAIRGQHDHGGFDDNRGGSFGGGGASGDFSDSTNCQPSSASADWGSQAGAFIAGGVVAGAAAACIDTDDRLGLFS